LGSKRQSWQARRGFLAGARPDITTENGNYAKSNIDVRLYDVKAPGGKLSGWFNSQGPKGGTTPAGTVIPSSNGFAVRDCPSTPGMERWLQLVFSPIRTGRSQQL
jgi:hypothetical protein